jgi:hypothetical protein
MINETKQRQNRSNAKVGAGRASPVREIYPVRECPTAGSEVHFFGTDRGFNAPHEFSDGVYRNVFSYV